MNAQESTTHDDRAGERTDQASALAARWEKLIAERPGVRIRDAAAALGVSEVELVATRAGEGATRLRPDFKGLFEALPSLGRVMASTRNEWAVIEKTGTYGGLEIGDYVGVVIHGAIDLRLFMKSYGSAWAVRKERRDDVLYSIQFFGHDGASIHKVYLREERGIEAWEALKSAWADADQSRVQEVRAIDSPDPDRPDEEIDRGALGAAWLAMQDTHEFFGMLRAHGVGREQSFRLAPDGHAWPLDPSCPGDLLRAAAAQEVPIMVFVPNRGCIEIHTGPVHKIVDARGWLNVFDPEFNLHARRDGFTRAWAVRKPTADGIVTSVEIFGPDDRLVAMFFGERKPGQPELEPWRALVGALPRVQKEG